MNSVSHPCAPITCRLVISVAPRAVFFSHYSRRDQLNHERLGLYPVRRLVTSSDDFIEAARQDKTAVYLCPAHLSQFVTAKLEFLGFAIRERSV